MRKGLTLCCLLLAFLLVFPSCTFSLSPDAAGDSEGIAATPFGLFYAVTFHPNNGDDPFSVTVARGDTVKMPTSPTRTGELFFGWYTDAALTKFYDFSEEISAPLDLYAAYITDYPTWTNRITEDVAPAVVRIRARNTVSYFRNAKQGSGVIFSRRIIDGSIVYYILTNNHVIKTDYMLDYSIDDAYGNTYSAKRIGNDASYDLAVLSLTFNETRDPGYPVVPLAESNPAVGSPVAALGEPDSQMNALTFGKITKYRTVTLSDTAPELSDVNFKVIAHTAPTGSGSSGGPLLDRANRIVGINYTGATDPDTGDFVCSFAIPADKINEFLDTLPIH